MEGLPLLPGLQCRDITQTRFHLPQHFNFVNGYRIPRKTPAGIGSKPSDVESVALVCCGDGCLRFDPSLTWGPAKPKPPPPLLPHYVLYGGKCLLFRAFFKEGIAESALEHYRIRPVNIVYYLEDDTITVVEPPTRNAGFVQGRLIKRGRIPKSTMGDLWHWKDLNLGADVCLYGKVFHLVDCDAFTREYLLSQGISLGAPEEMPPDPYHMDRALRQPALVTTSPSLDSKLRRFLEFGGKVLRFFCVWDDRESQFGEMRSYVMFYHLEDDTIEVQEVHEENDGRDPFPLLLRRTKLPRDWRDIPVDFPSGALEVTECEVTSYYTPQDLVVGRTVFVLGRRILLYDCDAFTRKYYQTMLRITQPCRIEVFPKEAPPPPPEVPPHNGFGAPEDAYQSCISLMPKPPRKDVVRQLINAQKVLRYTAHLDAAHPEDVERRFLIVIFLSEGKMAIHEPERPNSGFRSGYFLRPMFVPKPGAQPDDRDYYTPADLYIGARVVAFHHHFIVDGVDLHVYRYMQENPDKFPAAVVDNIRNWLAARGLLAEDVGCRAQEHEREAAAAEEAARCPPPCPPPPPPEQPWQEPPFPATLPPPPCPAYPPPAAGVVAVPAAVARAEGQAEAAAHGQCGVFPCGPP